jgi:release factor glutamine methyltransferase
VSTLAALRDRVALQLRALPAEQATGDARVSATHLLAAITGWLPAALALAMHRGDEATPELAARTDAVLARLAQGMPMAYATGVAAFRHLDLHVDARVLIPRPETEIVVEHALRVCAERPGGVAVDIGTGSGAIALSLAQEGRFDRVIATDVSADALDVARLNAARVQGSLRCPVEFRLGADLAPLAGERVRLIVSNPPYIAHHEAQALPAAVRDWEPPTALFAADDGMARYAEIVAGAPAMLEEGGWVVFECDAQRARRTAALFAPDRGWREVDVHEDLTGRDRVCVAQYGAPG